MDQGRIDRKGSIEDKEPKFAPQEFGISNKGMGIPDMPKQESKKGFMSYFRRAKTEDEGFINRHMPFYWHEKS